MDLFPLIRGAQPHYILSSRAEDVVFVTFERRNYRLQIRLLGEKKFMQCMTPKMVALMKLSLIPSSETGLRMRLSAVRVVVSTLSINRLVI